MKIDLSFEKLLFAFFAFIGLLIGIRVIYSGNFDYLFLAWNIFLAWIPFAISSLFKITLKEDKWKQVLLFCSWFIFFPNALYIVTDLIHLELDSNIPKWFDAVLLFSSSVIGLIMAFVSLHRVENYLGHFLKQKHVEWAIMIILFFGSFGVYLGRFLRWNSWDIIRNPLRLLSTIIQQFIFPLEHTRTWGITCILSALFYLMYLSIKKLPGYLKQAS